VGGDWFDVFPVAGGRIGFAIGDVMGHDLAAATAMAQIRASLRAYAIDGAPPAVVITKLGRLVETFDLTELVTVLYAVLDPQDRDGCRIMRYSNAGHLPPLVRRSDGEMEALSGGASVVLGAPIAPEHNQATYHLKPGSTLIMFTDGLVEEPGRSVDESVGDLSVFISRDTATDTETLCDRLLATARTRALRDDIALLVVRLTSGTYATANDGMPMEPAVPSGRA
jgi:serine phosphatase RsbU (regulator of sigma subunit)